MTGESAIKISEKQNGDDICTLWEGEKIAAGFPSRGGLGFCLPLAPVSTSGPLLPGAGWSRHPSSLPACPGLPGGRARTKRGGQGGRQPSGGGGPDRGGPRPEGAPTSGPGVVRGRGRGCDGGSLRPAGAAPAPHRSPPPPPRAPARLRGPAAAALDGAGGGAVGGAERSRPGAPPKPAPHPPPLRGCQSGCGWGEMPAFASGTPLSKHRCQIFPPEERRGSPRPPHPPRGGPAETTAPPPAPSTPLRGLALPAAGRRRSALCPAGGRRPAGRSPGRAQRSRCPSRCRCRSRARGGGGRSGRINAGRFEVPVSPAIPRRGA